MNALDTNILVRFLVQDDETQCGRVNRLFETAERNNETLFVPLLVMLELIWVLRSAYEVERNALLGAIESLLELPILDFERQPVVRAFIRSADRSSNGLADLLIAESCRASDCEVVLTFDKRAAKNPMFKSL